MIYSRTYRDQVGKEAADAEQRARQLEHDGDPAGAEQARQQAAVKRAELALMNQAMPRRFG